MTADEESKPRRKSDLGLFRHDEPYLDVLQREVPHAVRRYLYLTGVKVDVSHLRATTLEWLGSTDEVLSPDHPYNFPDAMLLYGRQQMELVNDSAFARLEGGLRLLLEHPELRESKAIQVLRDRLARQRNDLDTCVRTILGHVWWTSLAQLARQRPNHRYSETIHAFLRQVTVPE